MNIPELNTDASVPQPQSRIIPGWMSTADFFQLQYDHLIQMRDGRLDAAAETVEIGCDAYYRMAANDIDFAARIVKDLGLAVGIDVTAKHLKS